MSARYWLRRPGLIASIVIVVLVVLWALLPGSFSAHNATDIVPAQKLQGPSSAHLFGTDNLGRDQYARVVYGSRLSLQAAAIAVLVASIVGSLIGLVAAFVGGWVDDALMRVVDVLLAIPALLLSLAIITALGFGTINVAIAVGIASTASFARVMRAEVLRIRTSLYIEAATSGGVRWIGVLARHVLPNASGPVTVLTTLELGTALLAVSALSFLGFGAKPPAPEWGSLVSFGRSYLDSAWWMTTMPGLVVALVVLAVNRISRAIEDARR